MKYICLLYSDEKRWEGLPKDDAIKMTREYLDLGDNLRKSGHYLAGEGLAPTRTATVVRARNGKVSTTDGPYMETKEQLGGFYLIEAKDLNDAIQVAARIPNAREGGVEVRPVMQYPKNPA